MNGWIFGVAVAACVCAGAVIGGRRIARYLVEERNNLRGWRGDFAAYASADRQRFEADVLYFGWAVVMGAGAAILGAIGVFSRWWLPIGLALALLSVAAMGSRARYGTYGAIRRVLSDVIHRRTASRNAWEG
jgi:hypothetical protein